jgi:hypothetical protein
MKESSRFLLWALAIVLVCLPAAFVVTIALFPLWSWIEATFGIEAVGHSGPADWCFWTIYALLVLVGVFVLWLSRKEVALDTR